MGTGPTALKRCGIALKRRPQQWIKALLCQRPSAVGRCIPLGAAHSAWQLELRKLRPPYLPFLFHLFLFPITTSLARAKHPPRPNPRLRSLGEFLQSRSPGQWPTPIDRRTSTVTARGSVPRSTGRAPIPGPVQISTTQTGRDGISGAKIKAARIDGRTIAISPPGWNCPRSLNSVEQASRNSLTRPEQKSEHARRTVR